MLYHSSALEFIIERYISIVYYYYYYYNGLYTLELSSWPFQLTEHSMIDCRYFYS